MATLFNTKISQTYPGLFKTIDNAVLTAAFKELTDGSGNQSGLFLNTAGDFKVTAILEWGSLKDTGTGVTITQFVTAANGIENFNNDTTLPTSAAVKLYVDTKFSQTDTLTEVLGFGNTTSGKDIAVSAGDDITFTDTSKILMGTGSDLSIFHDGSHSYLEDTGTGDFRLKSNSGIALLSNTNEDMFLAVPNSFVKLYFNNSEKLATKNTGIDITGDLLVTGNIVSNGAGGSFLPLAGGTMTGEIVMIDNKAILFGGGGKSFIKHTGTAFSLTNDIGNITLTNRQDDGSIALQSDNGSGGTANYILIDGSTGAVELSHYGSKKFETTTTGASVTGNLVTTVNVNVGANATFVDGGKALFGDSNDLTIFHDGTNGEITNTTGGFLIKTNTFRVLNAAGTEQMLRADTDDAVQLYFNNVVRLATVTDGAKVTGNLEVTGTITGAGGSFLPLTGGIMTGGTIHNDNVKSLYGTSGDFEIFYDGTNALLDNYNGSLRVRGNTIRLESHSLINNFLIATQSQGVQLFFNDVQKFVTSNTGISVTGNGAFTTGVSVPDSAVISLGSQDDLQLFHTGSAGFIKNITGDLRIDQSAVTQSIVFRTSNNFALDTTALTISRNGDMLTGRNVTIAGDLTVNGTTTTVNSQTLAVVDPLIQLAKANTANSLDIGFYGDYNDGTGRFLGLFSDASDSNKFKLFKGTTVEPTTTVNIGGTGYVAADLVVAGLDASSVVSTGSVIAASGNSGQITLSANSIGSTNNLVISTGGGGSNIEMYNTEMYFDGNTQYFRSANAASTYLTINSTSASFAGAVSAVGNLTAARGFFNAGSTNVVATFTSTDATSTLQCIDSGGNVEFGASGNNFVVQPAGGVAQLTVGATSSTFAGNVNLIGANSPILTIQDTTDNVKLLLYAQNGDAHVGTYSNHPLFFETNSTTALTIDTSQNATFAGNVTISKADTPLFQLIDTTNNISLLIGADNSNTFFRNSAGNMIFQTAGGTSALTLDASQNATFAGNVGIGISPIRKLDVNSGTTSDIARFGNDSGNFTLGQTTNLTSLDLAASNAFRIRQGGAVPLSIDTSQNATFAGNGTFAGNLFIPTNKALQGSSYPYTTNVGSGANATTTFIKAGSSSLTEIELSGGDTNSNILFKTPNPSNTTVTALTLDTNQNATFAGKILAGAGATAAATINAFSTTVASNLFSALRVIDNTSASSFWDIGATGGSSTELRFCHNGTTTPKITFTHLGGATFTGSVGIANTNPLFELCIGATDAPNRNGIEFAIANTDTGTNIVQNYNRTTNAYTPMSIAANEFSVSTGSSATERMRITAAGNALFGITNEASQPTAKNFFIVDYQSGASLTIGGHTGAHTAVLFRHNGATTPGSIVISTNTTTYNTSSDYRLKEDLQDFAGLDMVSKIPVYDFKWKTDESRSYGVMAHELQEVLPNAVTGEKDAEDMQSVDYSKIVPLLIKSIQELTAKIERLEAK